MSTNTTTAPLIDSDDVFNYILDPSQNADANDAKAELINSQITAIREELPLSEEIKNSSDAFVLTSTSMLGTVKDRLDGISDFQSSQIEACTPGFVTALLTNLYTRNARYEKNDATDAISSELFTTHNTAPMWFDYLSWVVGKHGFFSQATLTKFKACPPEHLEGLAGHELAELYSQCIFNHQALHSTETATAARKILEACPPLASHVILNTKNTVARNGKPNLANNIVGYYCDCNLGEAALENANDIDRVIANLNHLTAIKELWQSVSMNPDQEITNTHRQLLAAEGLEMYQNQPLPSGIRHLHAAYVLSANLHFDTKVPYEEAEQATDLACLHKAMVNDHDPYLNDLSQLERFNLVHWLAQNTNWQAEERDMIEFLQNRTYRTAAVEQTAHLPLPTAVAKIIGNYQDPEAPMFLNRRLETTDTRIKVHNDNNTLVYEALDLVIKMALAHFEQPNISAAELGQALDRFQESDSAAMTYSLAAFNKLLEQKTATEAVSNNALPT